MEGYDIWCFGLTRVQKQTIYCHFAEGFRIFDITEDALMQEDKVTALVSEARCVFVNPKKLELCQLNRIVKAHEYAAKHSHASILVFVERFSVKQKQNIDTAKLTVVNLREGYDVVLKDIVQIVHKATVPCFENYSQMENNVFKDGWYLVDIETTGDDPIEDDIISLSVSYMLDYKIQSTETLYINKDNTKEKVVEYFNDLQAPIILKSKNYYLSFLKALFHLCGQKFQLPVVAMDMLAAIPWGYTCLKNPTDLTYDLVKQYFSVQSDHYERTRIKHFKLAELYDLTLMVFDALQTRYGVQGMRDFYKLYFELEFKKIED